MSDYTLTRIYPSHTQAMNQVTRLLTAEGLQIDAHLDYTAGLYDGDTLIATGSFFRNTLRCFAINPNYQGQALLNTLVSHLIEEQFRRGYNHLFVYTKLSSAPYFKALGFHEVAQGGTLVSLLENHPHAFTSYVQGLSQDTEAALSQWPISNITNPLHVAIVMNANPFTYGHLHLVETAAVHADVLHLFIVSEDASFFPTLVRKQLVIEGTKHIKNIVYHDCGPYLISSTVFPSYFQKSENATITSQALLDTAIFSRIAHALAITHRYVGDEPFSQVTAIYNSIMGKQLATSGITLHTVPRLTDESGHPISASAVRQALSTDNWSTVRSMVPPTTYRFLQSPQAHPILSALKGVEDVTHY